MGRRLSYCAAALLASPWACGPSLDVELDQENATSSGAHSSGTSAPDPSAPTEQMNSTGLVASSDDSDNSDTSDGWEQDDEGSNDDGYTCGCEETIPVSFDRVVDGEFSAATVTALVASTEIPWQWTAFVDAPPETAMSVALSYEGGQVLHGPDGDNGCSFLSSPCSNALVIPVVATLTTADSVLVASFPGTLDVDLDRWAQEMTFSGQLVSDELGGTLAEQLLADSGTELTSISVYLDWELDGTSSGIYLSGTTTDTEMMLGERAR